MKSIDLRSDTVTKPTVPMLAAMFQAKVGDDVYGEDPTINRLEEKVANLAGKEAGLFVSSGTQGNLLAILSHCHRGDEYIAGQQAHCYRYEGGGAAAFGGIQPQPIEFSADGTLDLKRMKAVIKPENDHFATSRLVCLENTQAGKILPLGYHVEIAEFVRQHGLSLHLDGARVFNAVVVQNVLLSDITRYYDSVTICLSKGLGAPVGSVLVGNRQFIAKARRWRKMAGGGMRQAGYLAAAGIFALENHLEKLAEDHARAKFLAHALVKMGYSIKMDEVQTNMIFIDGTHDFQAKLVDFLKQRHILVGGYDRIRLVTHLGITDQDINIACHNFAAFLNNSQI